MSSPLPAAPREETMVETVEDGGECWRERVVEKRWEEGKGGENGSLTPPTPPSTLICMASTCHNGRRSRALLPRRPGKMHEGHIMQVEQHKSATSVKSSGSLTG
ncbi:hypothetical protein E2C01_067542 [Portunus trituberculatus]|uniref:Uncharacterized protein n=1 Tax=Portunus trituberculatus TaxID=210409 RepID=A0A5B7HLA7_PORTR|nr:hypothetical protein [Portunus trituberculatus]